MARTFNRLFERIATFEALHAGYLRARAGKRTRAEVQHFERDLEGNLIELLNELLHGTYRTGAYRSFAIYEPKRREVAALPFRDRIVQHALCAVIEPIFEDRFIAHNYACRPGRGTHRGADAVQTMLRRVKRDHGQVYALKADISAYFASIDHAVLKGLFRKRIACRRTLALLDQIIDSADQLHPTAGVGLPIGNLVSQLAANVYLHELDLHVKHGLRERYYVRYMDDFIILHHDKAHLQRVREHLDGWLHHWLRLRTNSKTQVFPVGLIRGRAIDFLGYRIYATHRRLRTNSVARISHTLRRLAKWYGRGLVPLQRVTASVTSWLAHAAHADSRGLVRAVLGKVALHPPPSSNPVAPTPP
jgi:retron-type reverse transcriptase